MSTFSNDPYKWMTETKITPMKGSHWKSFSDYIKSKNITVDNKQAEILVKDYVDLTFPEISKHQFIRVEYNNGNIYPTTMSNAPYLSNSDFDDGKDILKKMDDDFIRKITTESVEIKLGFKEFKLDPLPLDNPKLDKCVEEPEVKEFIFDPKELDI